jgi:hypothetical protein
MVFDGLEVPALLEALILAGRWPRNAREAMAQESHPLVPSECVRQFAPGNTSIYFMAPPFRSIATEVALRTANDRFWAQYGALNQISPARSLIIGDFGIGSDSPIILDFRESNPPVLWLKWPEIGPPNLNTRWIEGAITFDKFAQMLGLSIKP